VLVWARKHPFLAALVFGGVLWGAVFVLSLFVPIVREICTKSEYTNNPDCAQHHFGPWVALWIVEVIDGHNGFVTALGTLAVAAFTWTLWRTSDRQASLTREAIDEAKISSERQLRAYVCVESSKVENFAVGSIPTVNVLLKNVGQTPAYRYRGQRTYGLGPFPYEGTFPFDFVAVGGLATGELPPRDLGPGGDSPISIAGTAITQEDFDGITNGSRAIFIFGIAHYDDVFGRPHETQYCLVYGGSFGTPANGGMSANRHGNVST
jgi:hypothetical protein